MSRFALLGLCGLGVVACRQLPEIPAGICGNGVIEAPEDCDGVARDGLRCRAPGAVGQCRLDCTPREDGTRTACPAGWGCDEQNACRRASGDFRVVAAGIPGNTRSLLSGDFDGDGRADVVGLEAPGTLGFTKTRVHYFDAGGAPRGTWAIGRQLGQPTVTHLFSDARADLAYSTGALGILSGEADGSLIPQAYPSYFLAGGGMRMIPVLEGNIDDSVAFLILATRDGQAGLFRADGATSSLVPMAELPAGIDALAAEPVTGALREDAARFPCRDVVLAYRGTREILLCSACDRDPETGTARWLERAAITRLPLAAPATIDRGLLLADLDGDGHRDLLVGTSAGPYAAFGDGASLGPLHAYPILTSPSGAPAAPMPIAAGDFAGDAAADLVLPDSLLVSVQAPGESGRRYRNAFGRLGSPWSEAVVFDFNANGKQDVIAASATGIDLDFFNGTGGENFSGFTIPTARAARHLAAGDFDGDLITDLAFVQFGSRSAPEDELSIAFGSPSGAPSVPATAARLSGITQVAPFVGGGDAVSSLTVTTDQPGAAGASTSALSLLSGSGDRSLPCPIELSTFAADGSLETAVALALASGSFVDRGQRDLVALGVFGDIAGDDLGMWIVSDVKHRRNAPRSLGRRFELSIRPLVERNSILELAIDMTAADLDRDGLDELLVSAPDPSGTHCIVGTARVVAGERLLVREPVVLEPCARASRLAVADLDADSALDVVLLLGDGAGQTKLMVLWGDGSGTLHADTASLVPSGGDAPVAFTPFRSTLDAPLGLAYVTEHGVAIARPGADRRFETSSLGAELEQGTGITAADVNGDGVVDLVVADSGNVRVLRAELVE